jgi:hypothetical protein
VAAVDLEHAAVEGSISGYISRIVVLRLSRRF